MPPPAEDPDDPGEEEVERILDVRRRRGETQYLVQWIGSTERTWEPEANFIAEDGATTEALLEFLEQQSKAQRASVRARPARKAQRRSLLRVCILLRRTRWCCPNLTNRRCPP